MGKQTIDSIKNLVGNNYSCSISAWVDVFEDNYEMGELSQVNYFDYDTIVYNTDLADLKDLLHKYIKDNCIFNSEEIYLEEFDNRVISSQQVNKYNLEVSKLEIEQFEKGKINLYNQYINFIVKINGINLTSEILKELI